MLKYIHGQQCRGKQEINKNIKKIKMEVLQIRNTISEIKITLVEKNLCAK